MPQAIAYRGFVRRLESNLLPHSTRAAWAGPRCSRTTGQRLGGWSWPHQKAHDMNVLLGDYTHLRIRTFEGDVEERKRKRGTTSLF